MVPITHYLVLSTLLFAIGVIGVLVRRNGLIVMMSVELMLNAVNLSFIAFARKLGTVDGHIFVFFVMAIAAAEAAVGLALIIALFRHRTSVQVDDANVMKG